MTKMNKYCPPVNCVQTLVPTLIVPDHSVKAFRGMPTEPNPIDSLFEAHLSCIFDSETRRRLWVIPSLLPNSKAS
jgi:hypothetical protein